MTNKSVATFNRPKHPKVTSIIKTSHQCVYTISAILKNLWRLCMWKCRACCNNYEIHFVDLCVRCLCISMLSL